MMNSKQMKMVIKMWTRVIEENLGRAQIVVSNRY